MRVRVLGCSGAIARDCRTTSFLIDGDILVDAGTGVGDLSLAEMGGIRHVLLTHSHLDHIAALPLMVDSIASQLTRPVCVHALPGTIAATFSTHALEMSSTGRTTTWLRQPTLPSVRRYPWNVRPALMPSALP